MLTNQQLRDQPSCPFQGSCESRREIVQGLYAKTADMAKKSLRDFACDKSAREPYIGASKTRNRATITAYILGGDLHIGCSDKSCPSLKANGRFFLGVCMDEPSMTIPKSLARAAEKEISAMKRGR